MVQDDYNDEITFENDDWEEDDTFDDWEEEDFDYEEDIFDDFDDEYDDIFDEGFFDDDLYGSII